MDYIYLIIISIKFQQRTKQNRTLLNSLYYTQYKPRIHSINEGMRRVNLYSMTLSLVTNISSDTLLHEHGDVVYLKIDFTEEKKVKERKKYHRRSTIAFVLLCQTQRYTHYSLIHSSSRLLPGLASMQPLHSPSVK